MYSVEVRCHVVDLAAVMSRMRQWLDDQRFEPDIFRHTVADESVSIRLQFNVEIGDTIVVVEPCSHMLESVGQLSRLDPKVNSRHRWPPFVRSRVRRTS